MFGVVIASRMTRVKAKPAKRRRPNSMDIRQINLSSQDDSKMPPKNFLISIKIPSFVRDGRSEQGHYRAGRCIQNSESAVHCGSKHQRRVISGSALVNDVTIEEHEYRMILLGRLD